jgi:hypothetical protein
MPRTLIFPLFLLFKSRNEIIGCSSLDSWRFLEVLGVSINVILLPSASSGLERIICRR